MPTADPATPPGTGRGSLRLRLLSAAALGIAVGLLAAGVALVALFRQHVEQELADRAAAPLQALIGALTVPPADGADTAAPVVLARLPTDPAFAQPLGGLYWWVADAASGRALLRSRSWWDALPPAEAVAGLAARGDDTPVRVETTGPGGEPLVAWARRVELAALDAPLVVAVGADATRLAGMTRRFGATVAAALGTLALALWAAAWLQVDRGLQPLAALRRALQRLRDGDHARLAGRFPSEVQPLVDDLHAVLDDNRRLVAQAREQTGNLAHALKTPLSVIANAADGWPGADGALVREQVVLLQRQVDLHLARARAAARSRASPGETALRTDAAAVVAGLLRAMTRLHGTRAVQATLDAGAEPVAAAVDATVLHEVLGNLLDNAHQWARSRVAVTIAPAPLGDRAGLAVHIDDDGPGIAPADRDDVLQRGRRLDERRPGSGLGLAIADELVRLQGGALALDTAPLGGLRVRVVLPAASAAPA